MRRITQEVQKFDRDLFCDVGPTGVLQIMRKGVETHVVTLEDGKRIAYPRPCPRMIVALTHDWTQKGEPVEWGLEPIYRKLKEIDTWDNPNAAALHCEKAQEKMQEGFERKRKNEQEAFLKDFRPQFARAFKDVNTSNINKLERRK